MYVTLTEALATESFTFDDLKSIFSRPYDPDCDDDYDDDDEGDCYD